MPRVDLVVECDVSRSMRVKQLEAMFDVPASKRSRVEWHANVPIDDNPWNVGLIVGPSGAGKSTLARKLFAEAVDYPLSWSGASVIDDFGPDRSMEEIARICQAVGFNTIPSWMRPYKVLSTGERFRVELARRMLECPDPIVVDEFTSVVDRQVGKIGSHAVQKWVRKNDRKFVAVTCHQDVVDWLQPDWIFEPATAKFAWRSVQPRPRLEVTVCRVHRTAWKLFSRYHYLTASMHKGARCFVAFVDDVPAAFVGVLHRPHFKARNIKGITRAVTLPDWQGLGLIFALMDTVAASYKSMGFRIHTYPAHPALIRSFDRSARWKLVRKPATFIPTGKSGTLGMSERQRKILRAKSKSSWGTLKGDSAERRSKQPSQGMRPCATFCYVGPQMADEEQAKRLCGEFQYRGAEVA